MVVFFSVMPLASAPSDAQNQQIAPLLAKEGGGR
jgi:hypothetical protein